MEAPAQAPAAAAPTDMVSFGRHAEMTYQDLWDQEPKYCQWVMKTFQQQLEKGEVPPADGYSPMERLAVWITEKEKQCESEGPAYEYNEDMQPIEIPGSRSLKERAGAMTTGKFYGVALPEKRICTSWEECKKYVHGIKGVMYRSFSTREEAEEYVNNPPARTSKSSKQEAKASTKTSTEGSAVQVETKEGPKQKKKSKKAKDPELKAPEETPADPASTAGETDAKEGEEPGKAKAPKRKAKKEAKTSTPTGADAEEPPAKRKRTQKGEEDTSKLGAPKKSMLAKAKAKAKAAATAKAKAKAQAKAEAKAKAKAAAKESKKAKVNVGSEGTSSPMEEEKPPQLAQDGQLNPKVLKIAEELGLSTALANLHRRPEIAALNFDAQILLNTLRECDGLVNKAKCRLLESGPTTPPKSQRTDEPITPEKNQAPAPAVEPAPTKDEVPSALELKTTMEPVKAAVEQVPSALELKTTMEPVKAAVEQVPSALELKTTMEPVKAAVEQVPSALELKTTMEPVKAAVEQVVAVKLAEDVQHPKDAKCTEAVAPAEPALPSCSNCDKIFDAQDISFCRRCGLAREPSATTSDQAVKDRIQASRERALAKKRQLQQLA